jgi:hypothetical protein
MNPAGGPSAVLLFELAIELMKQLKSREWMLEAPGVGYEFFPEGYTIVTESMANVRTITTTVNFTD